HGSGPGERRNVAGLNVPAPTSEAYGCWITQPRSAQNCSSARIMCWSERRGSGAGIFRRTPVEKRRVSARVYAAREGLASRSIAARERRLACFEPAQHLERAQALEALEVGAEEILDDAQQFARPRQLHVRTRLEQRPRQEQRQRSERFRGQEHDAALARGA